jgi:hypothetical protein
MSDVLRVHDYNYLVKIREMCQVKLKDFDNSMRLRYGNVLIESNEFII